MITRRKSEEFDSLFIPSYSIPDDTDVDSTQGIVTMHPPHPTHPYMVRVGGGYRAFTCKRHAEIYYRED